MEKRGRKSRLEPLKKRHLEKSRLFPRAKSLSQRSSKRNDGQFMRENSRKHVRALPWICKGFTMAPLGSLEAVDVRALKKLTRGSLWLSKWVQWSPRVPEKGFRDPLLGSGFRMGRRVLSGVVCGAPGTETSSPEHALPGSFC